jgi:hypothetical protein
LKRLLISTTGRLRLLRVGNDRIRMHRAQRALGAVLASSAETGGFPIANAELAPPASMATRRANPVRRASAHRLLSPSV